MALQHAQPLDVIDVRPFGSELPNAKTTSLLKTHALQLMRVVLAAGQSMPEHSVPGAITVLCLEGDSTVTTASRTCRLQAGQLVVLAGGERHSVSAQADSSLLVTLLLHTR